MTVDSSSRKPIIITTWIFLLLASSIPMIFIQEVLGQTVSENLRSAMAAVVILAGLALTFLWNAVRSLRPFFVLFLVLIGAEWVVFTQVDQLPFYKSWLHNPSFNVYMLAEQSLRLMVTLIIIAALFLLRKRASAFFLVKGDTHAPAEPVKWLGLKEGERWNTLGRSFALYISLGTLLFLVLAARPSLDIVIRVLPFLSAVLIAAAFNAFNRPLAKVMILV